MDLLIGYLDQPPLIGMSKADDLKPEQLIRVQMTRAALAEDLDAHYTETGWRAFAINAASWARAIRV